MTNEIITTLHPDQDPNTNLYPNIKKENIPDGSIDKNKLDINYTNDIDNKITSLNNDVDIINYRIDDLSDGSPRYVNTSTNILSQTTNKGLAVGTDTGHWYYWDGTKYVDGGVYQTVVNYDDVNNKVNYLGSYVQVNNNHLNNIDLTMSTGWYRFVDNQYFGDVEYQHSNLVDVLPNERYIVLTKVAGSCAGVMLYKADNTYVTYLLNPSGTSETIHSYKLITIPLGCNKMMVQGFVNYECSLIKVDNKDFSMYENFIVHSGEYVSTGDGVTGYIDKACRLEINVEPGKRYVIPKTFGTIQLLVNGVVNRPLISYMENTNYDYKYDEGTKFIDIPNDINGIAFNIALNTEIYFNNYKCYKISNAATYGKKWAVIGDSITEHNFRATKNYDQYINERLGLIPTNLGVSSSGFIGYVPNNTFCDRIDNLTGDYDIITVMGGTNDTNPNYSPLGSFGDTEKTTVYGAIDYCCKTLINKYPNSILIFITPIPNPIEFDSNYQIKNVVKAIIEVCNYYCIPVLDLHHNVSLYPWKDTIYFNESGDVHPNEKGQEIMANVMTPFFKQYF